MLESYYKILGLDMNATFDEVKKRYHKLAKKYHPDMNPGDKEMEEEFKKISTAYQMISAFMQDRCLKYQKIAEYCSNMISDMSDEKIIEIIKLIEHNINEINDEINSVNKANLKLLTDSDIFDLQSKIITIKYQKSLEKLTSQKSIQKFQKWFLYYFIPNWKNSFEEKYLNEERELKNSWSKQIDDIVEKICYNKLQIKKNWDDIDQMKKMRKDFYARKSVLNKELIRRHQMIKK